MTRRSTGEPRDALRDRVEEMVAWAQSRIANCHRAENKFAPGTDAMIVSVTERRALTAVLEQLGYPVPEPNEDDIKLASTMAAARSIRKGG